MLEEVHGIICPPPPVETGIMLVDGMAALMRGATSARGGLRRVGRSKNSFVGFSEMDAVIWAQNLR